VLQNFKFGTRIRPRSDCHQRYIVIVAKGCGYAQGLFWLPWRIILVGQENQIEATQNLPNVCFLNIRFLFLSLLLMPLLNANTALSLYLPVKFSNIVLVETLRYLIKITTLQRNPYGLCKCEFRCKIHQ